MTTPRTAAEQLEDIFDGDPPDGADLLIPQLAKQLFDEHRQLKASNELMARELQRGALDTTGPLREIAALRAELEAVAAERDQLCAAVDRTTKRLTRYYDAGVRDVNIRQVIGLLSPTWPDGNYEATPDHADAQTAPAAQTHPPHQVVVTHLPGGFDLSDRKPHEQLIGNGVAGWVSHLPAHPAACHQLPYGTQCWFDDEWEHGQYTYDDVQPGLYTVTHVREDVGDHEGEYSHTEEYLHYERTGDAPERPAKPEPWGGYSDGAPF